MSIESVLSRLEHVRRAGQGRWRAKCPVHGGKNQYALSIKEADDGTVLLHCFVCEGGAGQVASALGMDLADFFPPKNDPLVPGKRINKPHRASDTLLALLNDLRVAYVMCGDIAHGRGLKETDRPRALEAQKRIGRLLSELDMAA